MFPSGNDGESQHASLCFVVRIRCGLGLGLGLGFGFGLGIDVLSFGLGVGKITSDDFTLHFL